MASENKNFKFQIPRGLIEGGTQISVFVYGILYGIAPYLL